MSSVVDAVELEEPSRPQRSWFWISFWITILSLLAIYLYITFLKLNQLENKFQTKNGVTTIASGYLEAWQKAIPELDQFQQAKLGSTQTAINNIISEQIDKVFAPVYGQIPAVADFHYSIKGEYTELATMLSGKISNHMQTILFDDINFDEKLKAGNLEISDNFQKIMLSAMSKINEKTQQSLQFTQKDMALLSGVLHLTMEDVNTRFDKNLMALRLGGTAIGAGLSVASLKLLSKAIAKKVMAKAATKGVFKAVGIGGGAGTGCAALAWLGPAGCAVGGVIGAGAAWLAVDKIIILTDEHFNRDDFEIQVRKMVDEQKLNIKTGMINNYNKAITTIKKQNTENFNKLKNMTPAQAAAQ